MSLDHAIAEAAEAGARRALAAHVPKLALSIAEVAKSTGAGVTTIRRWVADGHLARVPHTDRVLIPVASLEAFVNSACASSAADPPPAAFDGLAGSTGAAPPPLGVVPPLPTPGSGGQASPRSTADGGSHPSSAA